MDKINKLIKDECANFDYENNLCLPKDKSCPFFSENNTSIRCGYFEKCVLPMKPALELQYRQERKLSTENVNLKLDSRCERCGNPFSATSNNQKYCEDCEKIVRKVKTKLRVRKNRSM